MDAQKVELAEEIDTWVQGIVRNSNSDDEADERILESVVDYMGPVKSLLDNCTKLEMTQLVNSMTVSSALPICWYGWHRQFRTGPSKCRKMPRCRQAGRINHNM